jgi:hypothetical protein
MRVLTILEIKKKRLFPSFLMYECISVRWQSNLFMSLDIVEESSIEDSMFAFQALEKLEQRGMGDFPHWLTFR